MPLPVVKGTVLFCSRECRVVLDRSRANDSKLVLDGVEDFVDGKYERGKVLCQLEVLERTW